MLTCPCHLPMLAALLGGTIVGAFFFEHRGVALFAFTSLFAVSLCQVIRRLKDDEAGRPAPNDSTSAELSSPAMCRKACAADRW